jgi:hypothetical protein
MDERKSMAESSKKEKLDLVERRRTFLSLAVAGVASACSASAQGVSKQDHVEWVARALKQIQTIQSGMTRQTLLGVFTADGGISTRLQGRYVSKDCPYFKVDVEFEARGLPERDADGRMTMDEDVRDIILKISRPYLQSPFFD